MRRLTPPTFPVFLVSLVLAILALASLHFSIPYVGHYVVQHRFWVMAGAYAVLAAGVIFVRL